MALERELEHAGLGPNSPANPTPAGHPSSSRSIISSRKIRTTTITVQPKPDPEDDVNTLVEDMIADVEVDKAVDRANAQQYRPPNCQQQQHPVRHSPPSVSNAPPTAGPPLQRVSSPPRRSASPDNVLDEISHDLDVENQRRADAHVPSRPRSVGLGADAVIPTPMDVDPAADAADLLEGEILGAGKRVQGDVEEEVEEEEENLVEGSEMGGADTDMDMDDELLSLVGDAPSKKKDVGDGEPGKGKGEASKASKPTVSPKSKSKIPAKAPSNKAKVITTPAVASSHHKADSPSLSPSPKKSRPVSPGMSSTLSEPPRSRSASVAPGDERASSSAPPDDDVPMDGDVEADKEDDRLYCICQSKYDENRIMIACDRCDEWYHTSCVSMRDCEVDLVDQFFCPRCIEQHPTQNFVTTYKPRCLRGLQASDPSSPGACYQPSRGAFSKYCSDSCGVKHMQSKIGTWTKKGGKKDKLWDQVKNAGKKQGGVIDHSKPSSKSRSQQAQAKTTVHPLDRSLSPAPSSKIPNSICSYDVINLSSSLMTSSQYNALTSAPAESTLQKLNASLKKIVQLREEVKRSIDVVVWREKLLSLANERAERVTLCGWDQRLCLGDEEVEPDSETGVGVLESYDVEVEREQAGMDGDVAMDEYEDERFGEWWCPGLVKCHRHAGWQALRSKDLGLEKRSKEDALEKLTTRERDIRRRIEDTEEVLDPEPKGRSWMSSFGRSKKSEDTNGLNVDGKAARASGVNGKRKDGEKKGRKRKAGE